MRIIKRTTIRKKIFTNMAIIILLSILMIIIGVWQFNKSKKFTAYILLLNNQILMLTEFKDSFEYFERELDDYFVTGSKNHKENIDKAFVNIFFNLETSKYYKFNINLLDQVENNCKSINKMISSIMSDDYKNKSSREKNNMIFLLYSKITDTNSIHKKIIESDTKQLQFNIKAQQDSIKNTVFVFFVIGFIILILYVILGFVLSIKISNPILNLKNTAMEISKGNLNLSADVKSSDEIGDLAYAFNRMTNKLQIIMNDLKNERDFIDLSINAIDDTLFVYNPDTGKAVRWNKAFNKKSGYTDEEIEELIVPDDYLAKKDLKKAYKVIGKLLKDGEIATIEVSLITKEGKRIPTEYTASLLNHDNGKTKYIISIGRDVTERKKAEEEIKNFNQELEEKVRNRTDQLNNTIEELKSFSYSISHDLRAPLRHINSYSELLYSDIESKISNEDRKYFNYIRNSAKKMNDLINDLLSFFRISKSDMNFYLVNLNNLVTDVLDFLSEDYKGRNINWKINNLPELKCDVSMIRQVFINFISNAVKFTRKTKNAEIEIGSKLNNNEYIIYVKDNGVGFDNKYYEKLFGVFQRLHSDSEFEGTGIGLALVKRIINRHNGKVWAEGKLNKGATFYFSLKK